MSTSTTMPENSSIAPQSENSAFTTQSELDANEKNNTNEDISISELIIQDNKECNSPNKSLPTIVKNIQIEENVNVKLKNLGEELENLCIDPGDLLSNLSKDQHPLSIEDESFVSAAQESFELPNSTAFEYNCIEDSLLSIDKTLNYEVNESKSDELNLFSQGLSPDSDLLTSNEDFTTPLGSPLPVGFEANELFFSSNLNSDLSNVSLPNLKTDELQNLDNKQEKVENSDISNQNCTCQIKQSTLEDLSIGAITEAWAELRSSMRQLHRSMMPVSSQSMSSSAHRTKPSVNRIKALANILFYHDPHQLYIRMSNLAHELCIELKVRLLSTLVDFPNEDQSLLFLESICESYQYLMSICEVVQPVLEKLDNEHLNKFDLNWVTVNMHTFQETILDDPDVREYLKVCVEKVENVILGKDILGCLASLKRTLGVSACVWSRAETLLQEYAFERAAINAHHRHLLSDWQPNISQDLIKSQDNNRIPTSLMNGTDTTRGSPTCECHFCNTAPLSLPKNASSSYIFKSGSLQTPHISTSATTVGSNLKIPCSNSLTSVHQPTHKATGTDTPMINDMNHDQASTFQQSSVISSNQCSDRERMSSQIPRDWNPYKSTTDATNSLDGTGSIVNGLENLNVETCKQSMMSSDCVCSRSYTGESNPSLVSTTVPSSSCSAKSQLHSNISTNTSVPSYYMNNSNHSLSTQSMTNSVVSSLQNYNDNMGGLKENDVNMESNFKQQAERLKTSVITHTRSLSTDSLSTVQQQDNDESDLSDMYEWSSADESDASTTTTSDSHQDPYCDCCMCHTKYQNQGGGRQKYSDRRDRLLLKLRKKKTRSIQSSSKSDGKSLETIANQNIDKILDFIEGKPSGKCKNDKKAAKKARQKKRKTSEHYNHESQNGDIMEETDEEMEQEEESGPLAELRRRAPDVTITRVKSTLDPSGISPSDAPTVNKRESESRIESNSNTGKFVPSLSQPPPVSNKSQDAASRPVLHAARPSVLNKKSLMTTHPLATSDPPAAPPAQSTSTGQVNNGLSNLLKGIENIGGNEDKGSQMVTIRRVMDPSSAEPTVTITLKGEQPEKDKVLFKLINGQAVPGNKKGKNGKGNSNNVDYPPLKIPDGLPPEEVKRLKKKHKKDRQRMKKQGDKKLEEEEKNQMAKIELENQQENIRKQVEQIEKQKLALQYQQDALMRQQQQPITPLNVPIAINKKGKKQKKGGESQEKNVSAYVYEGDDMSKNYNLPPGVSINKVAGQPGMVTISNNGCGFPQPFLSNPNVYPPSASINTPKTNYSMKQPNNLSWSGTNKCSSLPMKDNVIVVDAISSNVKAKSNNGNNNNKKEMTSDERIQAAVDGKIDPSSLNKTQKKKFKKMKKAIQEEKEVAMLKQKEEDDLMDQMYLLSRAEKIKTNADNSKNSKSNKKPNKQKETKTVQSSNTLSNNTNSKINQNKNTSKSSSKQAEYANIKVNTKAPERNSSKLHSTYSSAKIIEGNKVASQSKRNTPQGKGDQFQGKSMSSQFQNSNQMNNNSQNKSVQSVKQNIKTTTQPSKSTANRKSLSKGIKDSEMTNNLGPSIGFGSEDAGHDARYAQYLAANANALANPGSNNNSKQLINNENKNDSNGSKKPKKKKSGKKGTIEDLNTIDSVFTPKDVADGELDETERDVEAFKRFCFYNVARNSGEKPKVNFDIKDIRIKKKPLNGNL